MMYFYPPSKPRRVKGGIKAQARGSKSGASWWAKRWLALLDDFDIGARMSRGRSYARHGQVTDLEISGGQASASVQGSMSEAYHVRIGFDVIGERQWKELARELFAKPAAAASLLAGRMPEDIEKSFKAAGLHLFPRRGSDLDTECSCPDWSNPCKHTVAVFYLLAEEFERDPFLIFKLRGSGRKELVKMVKLGSARRAEPRPGPPGPALDERPEPLPSDPGKFWGQEAGRYDPGDAFVPKIPAALPKQLGNFPFWRGDEEFMEAMEKAYQGASEAGMDALLGEAGGKGRRP